METQFQNEEKDMGMNRYSHGSDRSVRDRGLGNQNKTKKNVSELLGHPLHRCQIQDSICIRTTSFRFRFRRLRKKKTKIENHFNDSTKLFADQIHDRIQTSAQRVVHEQMVQIHHAELHDRIHDLSTRNQTHD